MGKKTIPKPAIHKGYHRMEVKLVSDEKQFWDLSEAWKELQSLGAVKDITMTWEWISTWWEVFKENRNLAVLVVMDDAEVIGIAPFIWRKVRHFRLIPFIRMEFMASGEDKKDKIYSEYLGFVTRTGREKQVLEAVFEYLCCSSDINWDELLLPRMAAESPVVPLLFDLAETFELKIRELGRFILLYSDLPNSFEEYLDQLGGKTRRNVRRGMRELDKLGNVAFRIAETEEEVEAAKGALTRLHQSRWNQKGEPGVFSSYRFRIFHDKLISIAQRENWLRLVSLLLNGKPVACIYSFQFNGKIYAYQAGMEVSSLSYGILAHAHAIIHAISEGIKEYDFLTGDSDYKRRLARKQRETVTLRISKPSPKDSIYRTIRRLKEEVKTLRDYFLRKERKN